jgi:predicted Zn-dependent peptidase
VGNDAELGSLEAFDALISSLPTGPSPPSRSPAPDHEARVIVEERDSRQSHLVLTWRVETPIGDPRARAALTVYAMLLGGSMGSRLVTEIREQRGWAYSVRAEAEPLSDAAVLHVTAGLESGHAVEAVQRTQEIVAELAAEGPREDELDRARSAAAGRRALAFENTTTAAIHMAEEMLIHEHETTPADAVASLDSVESDDVAGIARSITKPAAVACVGPHSEADFRG